MKSAANRSKHGIDFDMAQSLWLDEHLLILSARGDLPEARWMAIGRMADRHWSAIFTLREDHVRLISVRRARDEEVVLYDREEP